MILSIDQVIVYAYINMLLFYARVAVQLVYSFEFQGPGNWALALLPSLVASAKPQSGEHQSEFVSIIQVLIVSSKWAHMYNIPTAAINNCMWTNHVCCESRQLSVST